MENLREAFLRAARGKSSKESVIHFREHLDEELWRLHEELKDVSFRFGDYHRFRIFEPKERMICASSFRERVAQHAMMRILHPLFDDCQTYDSYACRKGKGTYKALERAQQYSRRYRWFLKYDVCKYFDSIDHSLLYAQIGHLIKDPSLLRLIRQLLDSYEVTSGKGLPIGNLSSQYFANHYLMGADRFLKEKLHVRAMIRYMDDVVLWADDKDALLKIGRDYEAYVRTNLSLRLHPPVLNAVRYGVPLLGYVIHNGGLSLNRQSKSRFRRRVGTWDRLLEKGQISETECQRRYVSMYAFADKARCNDYLRRAPTV